jgi:hypothetical protein
MLLTCSLLLLCVLSPPLQELYSHYSQQVKDTSLSLSDPQKAYLLRKAVHYFNTRLLYRPNIDNYPTNKPIIQVGMCSGCDQPSCTS